MIVLVIVIGVLFYRLKKLRQGFAHRKTEDIEEETNERLIDEAETGESRENDHARNGESK